MMAFLALLCLFAPLVLLDLAAMLWGADSREGPDSAEWERRRGWKGYRS